MNNEPNLEDQYAAFNIEDEEEEELIFEGGNDDSADIDDRWCLVGRFLTHRSIDFQAMQNKMAQLWQPGRGLYVKELEHNLYLFQFYHEVDIERVMEGSPWTFDRVPLIFERLKQGENPRSVVLNRIEFWVQIHNMTTGFMSEVVIQRLGNYIGTYVKSDPNNFIGVWRDYLRIHVKVNIDQPLKRKKKVVKQGGMWCYALFKYEDLPTFCFICGVLGHTERFCDRLFDTPIDQIEKPYGLEMKAAPRRRNYAAGARWLRSGSMNRAGTDRNPGNPAVSNPTNLGTGITHNRVRSGGSQSGISNTINHESNAAMNPVNHIPRRIIEIPSKETEVINKEGQGGEQNPELEGEAFDTGVVNADEALLFLENKKRRMGLDHHHGLLEAQNMEVFKNDTNPNGPGVLFDVEMVTEMGGNTKNLSGAGSVSQTRREL
ncbi:uncharacterized protein LOC115700201 [Cannabis sativa]|uniref:uncharacterized protein LOC115700201 n=1 Tax=Cannabis sativa TaxID=3483 RepID=UPI0029C9DEC9|nr:uncharacterized protein LOC115700201 [Cannabis sativa]